MRCATTWPRCRSGCKRWKRKCNQQTRDRCCMQVKIYNTLTGTKEPLAQQPNAEQPLTMYTCGPTVYDSTHVGHLLPPLVGDVVKRYLQARGYEVKWAHNFTDVEDKIIRRANEEGVEP